MSNSEIQKSLEKSLPQRYRSEFRFKLYGIIAISIAMAFLLGLFIAIFTEGVPAFQQTWIKVPVTIEADEIPPEGERTAEAMRQVNFGGMVKRSMRAMFPEIQGRTDQRQLTNMVSDGAGFRLRKTVEENPDLVGKTTEIWIVASDDIDMVVKGRIKESTPADDRRVTDLQFNILEKLRVENRVEKRFNTILFTNADSAEPELAGILGALVGSLLSLAVTLVLAFPLGVLTALYLEEFAPKNKFTDLIEVNINNLAAVPSIVFGLLGLAIFLNFFELPRSSPLVGGMVLALMTLPTIIIAARASLRAVPPGIREAALGVGASPVQTAFHHTVPLALPGMLTGTIIGMAQALGETAPLLMIGMVAFIVGIPEGVLDAATALPVQIFLWADRPERAFTERTAAAIIVLLVFLVVMNATAVYLRKRFERRWD